jgi:hypothetical protein
MPSLGGGGRYGGDDPSGGASRSSGGYGMGGGGGIAGSWNRRNKTKVSTGPTKAANVLGVPATVTSVTPTVSAASVNPRERAAALGARVSLSVPALGALEDVLSKPATAHMRDLGKQIGPGEVTKDKTFEPERGVLGTIRDFVTPGKETQVSAQLAATAYNKGVLGELTGGIRSGVVGTEDIGARAVRDPVGQALSVLDVAQSLFGLPSPRQLMNPIGAAMGAVPVAGVAYSLYNLAEEQSTLSALAKAGVVPTQERTQRAVANVTTATRQGIPTDGLITSLGERTMVASIPTPAETKPEGFDKEMIRRTALRGFGSTRRTGKYGITGPLAVRA